MQNQEDPGKKPAMKQFTGIGTFAPTPASKQPFNHGHSPQKDLAHPKPPEHSDESGYQHKLGK